MTELLRLTPGTLPQWGTFLAVLTILAGMLTVYIKGIPDRARVRNESKVIDNTEAQAIRAEYTELNRQARNDIHTLRNELARTDASQIACNKALANAHAENRIYRDDVQTLLFLIRLLVSEVKRLDPDPRNIIIEQAEMMLAELERKKAQSSPAGPAETADLAVTKAEETVKAAVATVAEIKAHEGGATT